MTKRINSTVTDELFAFAESIDKGNKSFVVREALRCLRLVKNIDLLRQDNTVTIQANSRGIFVSLDTSNERQIIDAVKVSDLLSAIELLAIEAGNRLVK